MTASMTTLQTEITALKNHLTTLILKLDYSLFHETKDLEAQYMAKIGETEFKSYVLQNDILRLRRKIELINELVTEKRVVDLSFVDKIVDIDFADAITSMQEQANLLKLALAHGQKPKLPAEQLAEINNLYKIIVTKIHPDLNTNLPSEAEELFKTAVKAYINLDQKALAEIAETAQTMTTTNEQLDLTKLEKEKESLNTTIKTLEEHLVLIQKSFPFNTVALLHSDEELAAKLGELHSHIQYYQMHYDRYHKQLETLVTTLPN